ncbi:rod shape-determining protein MreC [Fusibacter ferrireducens]|uniref:Cell shape-determining protein MreC n=1 Tax=Fusibacter ferrireducens TaxID=2785058 RepID=A0ABR9ZWY0_9FIRM|nr:rod shape-determining protein MreC [Fusibacter ferrireducens]MBF4694866.1 rod shape-determining protein MreC [Fusibacter ferrireducens]
MNERYKKWIVVLMGIILIVLMAISFGGRERITFIENQLGTVLSPVQRFLSGIGNFVDEKTEPIINVLNYKTLNEDLTLENENLKEQIVALTLQQKELKELEDLSQSMKYINRFGISDYVSCNVISKDIGNWFNMFTIDAGRNQGIVKNSTVINGNGLVGLVYEVGDNWSKIISIIDHKSAVGFEMLRVTDDYDGILNGTSNYELVGELYDPKAVVNVNDYIVTSGLGMYPKGILIGRIYEVVDDKDLFLKKIKVVPAVNFKKINKVMVIPYHETDESSETTDQVESTDQTKPTEPTGVKE